MAKRPALVVLLVLLIGMVVVPAVRAQGCAPIPVPQGITPPGDPNDVDCANGQAFNILPAGDDGLVNAQEYASSQQPPHQQDQLAMYRNLVAGVAGGGWNNSQIGSYYKNASLSFDPNDPAQVDRVDTFSNGSNGSTAIVWDKAFGIPHVYGDTRYATEFGAGYAGARDRLFLMDTLRHVGRAQLSAFIGPSPSDLAMDCSVARIAGYSEQELQAQVDQLPVKYTAPFSYVQGGRTITTTEGAQVVADGQAYVDGVNAYIQAALTNPALMPVEYPALQEAPAPWKVTDVVAVATIVQAIFATGGGGEVDSALFYQALVNRYGQAKGKAIWQDLRSQNDPAAPTTIPTAFPYMQVGKVVSSSVAMPASEPTTSFCNGGAIPSGSNPGTVTVGPISIDLYGLLHPHMSNALLVSASHSASGHPIAVFGPQVGYYSPEILHEVDLHGPGIEARGAAFPGTDIFIELGRGVDYAWSATSAGSDITDERIDPLCNTDGSAPSLQSTATMFNGVCTPMFERTDSEVAKTSGAAANPPQVITIQIERAKQTIAGRTVFEPVVGRTTATDPATGKQIPVAVVYERSTFGDELGSAPAFLEWNNPDFMHGASSFLKAAAKETGTFNWFYVDAKDIAYYSSGLMPVRPKGVNPNFPSWGSGQWEWQGFLPANGSSTDPHPHAIDPSPGFMVSWNNKPAPGWSAADDNYAYGPVYRSLSLSDRLQSAMAAGPLQPSDVVRAMEDAGTVDLDGSQLVPSISRLLSSATLTPAQSQALGILTTWAGAGAHRRDLTGSGSYEQGDAVAIMDALYPQLAQGIFGRWLDRSQFSQLTGIMGLNDAPSNAHVGSAYDGGWEGYLQRAVQQSMGTATFDYSQSYCGSLAACQQTVLTALDAALAQLSQAYGSSDPATWTCSRSNTGSGQCNPAHDDIVYSAVGVASIPNQPWINRPTFQQVVTYPDTR